MRRLGLFMAVLFALALSASPVSAQGACAFRLFDLSGDRPTEVETLTYRLGPDAPGIGFKLSDFAPNTRVTIDLMKNGETYQSDEFSVDAEGQLSQQQNPNESDIGNVTARATGEDCTAEAHYTVLPALPDTSTAVGPRGAPLPGAALLLLAIAAAASFATALRRFAR
jgi:hypothetical protein